MVEEQILTQAAQLDAKRRDLRIEVIRDLDRFNSMATEWDRLVDRSPVERVFLSHAWLSTWWETFAADRELHIIAVKSGDELVGAVPMMRGRRNIYGVPLDSIESIYNPHTPRWDFIIADGLNHAVYRLVWSHLHDQADCDMIVLNQVPDPSGTIAAVESYARGNGWLTGQWGAPPSPYIPLSCTYEEFFGTLKGGYRYNLRKRHERLSKVGPVDVEVITDRQAVREAMQDGLRIEAAAWKGTKGTAILSDPAVTEFYVRLAERQADLGQLRLTFLRVGGKRISFNYILSTQKKLYGVKIGYDPEYHTYSPGNMHLGLILQDACEEQIAEYDFLGVDDEWKLDWTKSTRGHRWLFLFRNHLRPRLAHFLKFTFVPEIKNRVQPLCTYLRGRA
jgi:CelD/BcsL family acetyltransferase involved in cellulose biosynthesis